MKVNQLKAGAVLSYISMGLGYVVALIYTPIMLRLLGQAEYGLYNLVLSVVSYLVILNFGFGSAYMRYYSRYKVQEENERIAVLNGMFLIVFSALGFVAVLLGSFLALNSTIIFGSELTPQELSTARVLMGIMIVNLALSFPNIVFDNYIMANERFVFQKSVQFIKILTSPLVILPVLYMGYGSIGMAIATTAINVVIEIVNIVFAYNKLNMRFSFRNFDMKLMKEMTFFSVFIFINMISAQISWNIDKLILGRFHGTISVAVYSLAAQINMYYLSIGTTISHLFIPRVHKLVASTNSKSDLMILFIKIGRIQFMVLALIATGFIFFGKAFILFWAGENYSESYTIILLLILPATLPLVQNIGTEIQRAKNMHSFSTWVYLASAIMNLIISIPLARMYQGVGAAIGTALALIIGNGIILNWYYHNKVGLDIKIFWKQIIRIMPSLAFPIIYGVFIMVYLHIESMMELVILGTTYVILYAISLWLFGMNQFEKNLFLKPIAQYMKKNDQ